ETGASFASKNLSQKSDEERSAVQVGDPFLEKLLMEATLECIRSGLVLAVQDMGAAGLISSSSEMAASGGVGIRLELEKVPAREDNMQPFEFMLSESQERMLMVVAPENWEKVKAIFDKWELDAAIIGKTTAGKNLEVTMNGQLFADVPAELLAKKAPRYVREQRAVPMRQAPREQTRLHELLARQDSAAISDFLTQLFSHPNLCSRRPIHRQYDTDIGLGRVIGPGQNACVVRVPESNLALALAIDGNGYYIAVEPYKGAQHTVAEALRNIAATGAVPLGLTNCLNFADPYVPENYWYFAEAVRGMSDACRHFGIPIVSGNVSFYNQSEEGPVLPTPTMGLVGLIENAELAVPAAPWEFSAPQELFLCGKFRPTQNASQYHYALGLPAGGPLAELDLDAELWGARTMAKLAQQKILTAAIDLSAGGFLRALLRMAFAAFTAHGQMPAIQLQPLAQITGGLCADTMLLGETAHCYLVAVAQQNAKALVEHSTPDFPVVHVGTLFSGGGQLQLEGLEITLEKIYQGWSGGLEPFFRGMAQ
ncbi:MAG: AIR synthase-related protein, partial [Turneriella sp.]|nr:AIR synthase-related protein [Turneriella sp.]